MAEHTLIKQRKIGVHGLAQEVYSGRIWGRTTSLDFPLQTMYELMTGDSDG